MKFEEERGWEFFVRDLDSKENIIVMGIKFEILFVKITFDIVTIAKSRGKGNFGVATKSFIFGGLNYHQ